MTANSKTKSTNKRITKADLNQLAKSIYGEEVYCEHVRSGKRGWYLHQGTQQSFIGANATEAYTHLQSQEDTVTETSSSEPETTTNTKPDSEKIEENQTLISANQTDEVEQNKAPVSASSKKETAENQTPTSASAKEEMTETPTPVSAKEETAEKETPTSVSAKEETAETETPTSASSKEEAVTSKTATSKKAENKPSVSPQELLDIFFEKFPNSFFREAEKIRPIQKYIHKKIRQVLSYEYTKEEVSAALALYTQSIEYCQALIKGGQRIDLNGKSCGDISEQHQEDAKARLAGEKPMRPAKQKKPKPPLKPLPPPQLDKLVEGKMELCVKINDLPADSKTTRNGWEEFIIEIGKHNVKMTVRPRTWKKLQNAAREYPEWVANIRGKMGPNQKNSFELLNPGVQIFEKIPKKRQLSANSENETLAASNAN
jgi:chemotaxis protein histidine kinase CheA